MVICPKCGGSLRAFHTDNTSRTPGQTYRRRRCTSCGARFETVEVEACQEAMETAYKDLDRKTTRADYRRGKPRPLPWRTLG